MYFVLRSTEELQWRHLSHSKVEALVSAVIIGARQQTTRLTHMTTACLCPVRHRWINIQQNRFCRLQARFVDYERQRGSMQMQRYA